MKSHLIAVSLSLFLFLSAHAFAQNGSTNHTLTIVVEGVDSSVGSLGVLIFNNEKGWPEDRFVAFRDLSVPAQQGTQTVKFTDLPPGNYAVALIHDSNSNHKIDKNWVGQPKEQWGMSNSLHAKLKAPPMEKALFALHDDKEIHIELNNP
jgi:uncharacterized protein (DUF2141 family)